MRQALRPHLTAGLAIAGAGIIAVAPFSAPPPDLGGRSVEFSSVQLASAELPRAIQALDDSRSAAEVYQELIILTGAFMSDALAPIAGNPAPILSQLLANQFEYLNYLAVGVTYGAGNTVQALGQLPGVIVTAAVQLGAGDAEAAIETLWTFVEHSTLQVVSPFMQSLLIPGMIAQNIANVAAVLPVMALDLGLNTFETVSNTVRTTAAALQSVIEAATSGDPLAAADAIVAAPGRIATALLVGDLADGGDTPGLINGVFKQLVLARETIAEALGAPPREIPEAAAARSEPDATPTSGSVEKTAEKAAAPQPETQPETRTELPAEPESTGESDPDAGTRTAALVRNSAKAVPGKTGPASGPGSRTATVSTLRADAGQTSTRAHKPSTGDRHDKLASSNDTDD